MRSVVSRVLPSFYRVIRGCSEIGLLWTGSYLVLPGFYCFYRVFTGFNQILRGFTEFYWVLLGFTGFYWVFVDSGKNWAGSYLVLLGFCGLYQAWTRFD